MTIGQLFFILSGVGVNAIPNVITWGFFCLAFGHVTGGYPLWRG
jgi:hypothetical protein